MLTGAFACSDDASPVNAGNGEPAGVDSGSGDTAAPSTCAPATGDGAKHSGNLETAQETWTAAGSPHVIDFSLSIREGESLTLEPCAVVRIRKDMGILVEGTLTAEGGSSASGAHGGTSFGPRQDAAGASERSCRRAVRRR